MMQRLIAVIGESAFSHPDHATLAEEVGGHIAAAGCGLICGGLGGVMEAAFAGRPAGVQPAATAEEAVRLALKPYAVARKPEP